MQGTYQWGERDCLGVLEEMAKEYLPDYQPIYVGRDTMTEKQAWRIAHEEYGSALAGHRAYLTQAGLLEATPPIQPGDVAIIHYKIHSAAGCSAWDGSDGHETLAFVDDSYRFLCWNPCGLQPANVDREPIAVFRFPALVKGS